jgi:DNA (cytosine-5)-methyltransferase 1
MFGELAPWVSMADALGWTGEDTPVRTLCGDRSPRWMYPDPDGTHGRVVMRAGAQANASVRTIDEPAPTVLASWDNGDTRWELNRRQQHDGTPVRNVPVNEPAPTVTGTAGAKSQWQWERPATTIAGDPRLSGPGRNDPDIPGSQYGENSVKLTLSEALTLQSFRPDYPVQGTKSKRFEQVGNAVPPLLAAHVVAAVAGLPQPNLPTGR